MAEISDALVASAKTWLRITSSTVEDEIKQVMEACLIDLKNAGVVTIDPDDAMIKQALKLHLKSQFGYDSEADRFGQSYEFLKNSLALSGDYNVEESNG